jgi:hypothetical protein
MKLRLPLLFVIGGLPLALGTIAGACGDDDRLTLDEYFQRYDATWHAGRERMEALEDPSQADFDSDEKEIEAYRAFLTEALPNIRDLRDALIEIDPPADVESLHDEAVDALTDGLEVFEESTAELGNVESTIQMEEMFELTLTKMQPVSERQSEACIELQAIADANGIDVDLECEGEE